ncbi:MAG: hypothetical protein M1827_007405 [Pycnora praestabilis]|nr:MAG: hypothetical protein M1827_007405 [Pycnora praestabilis]
MVTTTYFHDSQINLIYFGNTGLPYEDYGTYLLNAEGKTTLTLRATDVPSYETTTTTTYDFTMPGTEYESGTYLLSDFTSGTFVTPIAVGSVTDYTTFYLTTSATTTASFTNDLATPTPGSTLNTPIATTTSSPVLPLPVTTPKPVSTKSPPMVTMIMGLAGGVFSLSVISLAYYFYRQSQRRKVRNVDSPTFSEGSDSSSYTMTPNKLEKGIRPFKHIENILEPVSILKKPYRVSYSERRDPGITTVVDSALFSGLHAVDRRSLHVRWGGELREAETVDGDDDELAEDADNSRPGLLSSDDGLPVDAIPNKMTGLDNNSVDEKDESTLRISRERGDNINDDAASEHVASVAAANDRSLLETVRAILGTGSSSEITTDSTTCDPSRSSTIIARKRVTFGNDEVIEYEGAPRSPTNTINPDRTLRQDLAELGSQQDDEERNAFRQAREAISRKQ